MYVLHVRFDSIWLLNAIDHGKYIKILTDFDPCSRRVNGAVVMQFSIHQLREKTYHRNTCHGGQHRLHSLYKYRNTIDAHYHVTYSKQQYLFLNIDHWKEPSYLDHYSKLQCGGNIFCTICIVLIAVKVCWPSSTSPDFIAAPDGINPLTETLVSSDEMVGLPFWCASLPPRDEPFWDVPFCTADFLSDAWTMPSHDSSLSDRVSATRVRFKSILRVTVLVCSDVLCCMAVLWGDFLLPPTRCFTLLESALLFTFIRSELFLRRIIFCKAARFFFFFEAAWDDLTVFGCWSAACEANRLSEWWGSFPGSR